MLEMQMAFPFLRFIHQISIWWSIQPVWLGFFSSSFFFFPFPKEGYWMLMQSHVIKQRVNEGNYLKPGSCSWAKWKQFIFIQFQKQPVLLNKFVFQCTFFLLFQTLLPTPMRVLEPACAGSTERQFSKNSHEHTSTTSSKQNSTCSYQLNAQLAMVGKKPQDTRSDLDLPDPSGLDLPRTLCWAYLALVSEEKWVLLSSGKAAAAFPWGLLCTLEQGTRVSELVSRTRPLRLLWKTYPNLARRLTSIKKSILTWSMETSDSRSGFEQQAIKMKHETMCWRKKKKKDIE